MNTGLPGLWVPGLLLVARNDTPLRVNQNALPSMGQPIVAGVGVSGHIVRKLTAIFALAGTPRLTLHIQPNPVTTILG
jgi:D-arabinose 5-phosphate isomerase GutQ